MAYASHAARCFTSGNGRGALDRCPLGRRPVTRATLRACHVGERRRLAQTRPAWRLSDDANHAALRHTSGNGRNAHSPRRTGGPPV